MLIVNKDYDSCRNNNKWASQIVSSKKALGISYKGKADFDLYFVNKWLRTRNHKSLILPMMDNITILFMYFSTRRLLRKAAKERDQNVPAQQGRFLV